MTTSSIGTSVVNVRYEAIEPDPEQPRKVFDPEALGELATSIQTEGLLQPISVRPHPESTQRNKRYIIIAGERRWRAVGTLGWDTIPAIVRKDLTDAQAAKMQLLENIVRQDLNPVEEARAFQKMLDEGYTPKELGDALGVSSGHITHAVKLLNAEPQVLSMVADGTLKLNYGHSIARLSPQGQTRVLSILGRKPLTYVECHNLCDRILDEENQADMALSLQAVSAEEKEATDTFATAFAQTIRALEKVQAIEEKHQGRVAKALGSNAEYIEGQIDNVIKALAQVRKSIRTGRMLELAADAQTEEDTDGAEG